MNELTFHFLNVGKGNCTIVEFPSTRLSVIDIDDSRAISELDKFYMEYVEKKASLTDPINYIKNYFKDQDIFRFILTHPDMDHMSGIKELFKRKPIFNFWDTENDKFIDPNSWDKSSYDKEDWDFYQAARRNSTKNPTVLKLHRGASSDCCWVQDGIEILAPTPELVKEANQSEDYDHLSYVLMIKHAGKRILLGGDATKKVWEDIINNHGIDYIKSDVFLAPNHGSPNHISKEILDAINPDLTIVSVADGVQYAYNLYSNYGIVLSTKYFGNIWVKLLGNGKTYFKTQFQNYSGQWYELFNNDLINVISRLLETR